MNWLSPQALVLAWQKVQTKSHAAGIDGMTVDNFATTIRANLEVLRQQLISDVYSNSPARGFYIPKKAGKRLIGIATVTDRIVQRLLLHQIYFQLEEQFLDCSYAYRPGRGIHSAIEYFQNVHSFIQGIGLHSHFGNLHVPRDNHPALVSDLMEEFRAQFVDSLVVYLINSKIFTEEDFTNPDKNGGVYLQYASLKKFLKHWEDKLQTQITHPYTGYKVTYRRCIELQVREYIACLMGETEVYRPMLWNL